MATQIITTAYTADEFKSLIAEFINEALKNQLTLFAERSDLPNILTRQETAALLNISLPTLHDYTKRGLIPCYRIGCKIRYKREDIESALKLIKTSVKR